MKRTLCFCMAFMLAFMLLGAALPEDLDQPPEEIQEPVDLSNAVGAQDLLAEAPDAENTVSTADELCDWINEYYDTDRTVTLLNDIIIDDYCYLKSYRYEPDSYVTVNMESYKIIIYGKLSLYGAIRFIGAGENGLFRIEDGGILEMNEKVDIIASRDGATAIVVNSRGELSAQNSYISACGENAAAIVSDANIELLQMGIKAEGVNSTAISCTAAAEVFLSSIVTSGAGARVFAGNENRLTIDTSYVYPAVPGAENIVRTVNDHMPKLFIPVGAPAEDVEIIYVYEYESFSLANINDPRDVRTCKLPAIWEDLPRDFNTETAGSFAIPGRIVVPFPEIDISNADNPVVYNISIYERNSPPDIVSSVFRDSQTSIIIEGLPYLPWAYNLTLYRSDDLGETWYDITYSEDVYFGRYLIHLENLDIGKIIGLKLIANEEDGLQGASEPLFFMLEPDSSLPEIPEGYIGLGGDRNGDGRYPKVTGTNFEPEPGGNGNETEGNGGNSGNGNTNPSGGGSTGSSYSSSSQTALTAPQITAQTTANPNFVTFVKNGVKVMVPSTYLKELDLQNNETLLVTVKKPSNSTFFVSLSVGGKEIQTVTGAPITVYSPYTIGENENADLLACADKDGKIIPASYYDAGSKQMILKTFCTGLFTIGEQKATAFSDANSHWAKHSIAFLSARGIVSGIGEGRFNPEGNVTHSEFLTMLARTYAPFGFTDARGNNWYDPYVNWAKNNGIAEQSVFPEKAMTREESAVYLYRYAQLFGITFAENTEQVYKDDAFISKVNREAVYAMTFAGVFKGFPDNSFKPGQILTRAESAEVLKNFIVNCLK